MKLIMINMRKLYIFFIISSFIIIDGEALPKQVCIIGAGRAGLAAIKIVADQIGKFTPIAFERNSDVGGLWIYSDKTDKDKHGLPIQSAVYQNLRTIVGKDQMVYPDYRQFTTTGMSPFVSHDTFLQYMRNYTNHFHLRKYIQFDTLVTKVTPFKYKCKRSSASWQVESRNLNTNKIDRTICDGVIVCNGRYSKPNIPKIPGIELFSGRVMHSHAYRKPEEFTAKNVIVWGAGASAIGITRDLSSHAKTVFLSHRQNSLNNVGTPPPNVLLVKNIVKYDGLDFVLEDNMKIHADALIYCTGYVYDFPFLDGSSGIARDPNRLFPLTRNFINKEHPTMAFIGLADNDISGHSFYDESRYFLAMLKKNNQ